MICKAPWAGAVDTEKVMALLSGSMAARVPVMGLFVCVKKARSGPGAPHTGPPKIAPCWLPTLSTATLPLPSFSGLLIRHPDDLFHRNNFVVAASSNLR